MATKLRRTCTILVLIASLGAAPPPCATVTTTITDLRPRTPRERVWYATAVCYRQRMQDAQSLTKSATTSLAPRIEPVAPAQAEEASSPFFVVAGAGVIGALVGFLVGVIVARR